MNMLSSLEKIALDEKISQGEVAKQVDAIKQLVSHIKSSCQTLARQEEKLRKARQLLYRARKEQAVARPTDHKNPVDGGTRFQENLDAAHLQKDREIHTREELEKLKEQVEQYKKLVDEVKQQVRRGPGQDNGKENYTDSKNAELDRIEREVREYKDEIQNLLGTIAQEQQLMQQVYELQVKLKKEKQQLTQTQHQLNKDQAKLKEAQKKTTKLRAQLDREKAHLERERASGKKKEEDLKADRARLRKKEEEINSDRKSLDQDKAHHKRELKKYEQRKEKLEEESKKVESDRKKVQKEKDRLKKDVAKAQTTKERYEKERAKADQECTNAQKRKEKILGEIQKALAEEKEKLKELKEIEKTKAQLKAELEQIKKEKRKMEKRPSMSHANQAAQKQSSSGEASDVRQKLIQLENENKMLKKKLESSPFNQPLQQSSSDSWPKMAAPKPGGENKAMFSFAKNQWLRTSSISKKPRNVPSFSSGFDRSTARAGGWPRKDGLLSGGFPISAGPPGLSTAQPMGGLMFAQRGTKVKARYQGDNKWYDAEVIEVILNGSKGPKYIVKFKGYADKEEVTANDIRPKDSDALPPHAQADTMQVNGHPPTSHTSALSGQRAHPSLGWPALKTDRNVVWGRDVNKPSAMVLNGLNGAPLMKSKMGRSQYIDAGFYTPHMENGNKQSPPTEVQNGGVLKSMLNIDRERS
uniref:Tudor domain-containing protein n=2 Tax=Lotharella globosa TaxID=91324 RepID=A0A7S3YEN3_9EUKA|mmetsp:Transcript_3677/g.7466  ORF Transcript_3677/g.7466 Transcript_3677/m.7466 type:complete len:698 (+) Transcript_3677:468-2561(+)